MKFLRSSLALFVVAACCGQLAAEDLAQTATGIVFHDANGNRKLDEREKRLPDIKVSNGREIVKTAEDGSYRLNVDDDTILFVIKPRGWRTPLDQHHLPRFYYIHKPNGSPKSRFPGVAPTGPLPASIDFPLYPQEEPDQFRAILFGDPQPRDQKEIDYIAHDVVEELIGTDASLGVTLGDILFDDLSLFKSINATIGLIGIPWYNVIGNHDLNTEADHDHHSDETFESVYGPSYYSFDHGPVHFLVLDDVDWHIPAGAERGTYRGGLGSEQLAFIEHDLAMIPANQLVVLMMHIPLTDVHDRQPLYRLIEKRPFCISISGHTHYQEHRFIKKADGWLGPEPHHHIVNVTVSGSWWSGKPDENGIPHTMMSDGAPNGYSIISFDGTKYSLQFKAARRPADYQIRITAPEVVPLAEAAKTSVLANVFNGSERSQVEIRLAPEGKWSSMSRTVENDPTFLALREEEKQMSLVPWQKLKNPMPSQHLWKGPLPEIEKPGTYSIEVRAREESGKTYTANRTIRVIAAP